MQNVHGTFLVFHRNAKIHVLVSVEPMLLAQQETIFHNVTVIQDTKEIHLLIVTGLQLVSYELAIKDP